MEDTITLYRPVGPKELQLLKDSGFRRWPPRLPEQPIFYPVTNEQYAIEIELEQLNDTSSDSSKSLASIATPSETKAVP